MVRPRAIFTLVCLVGVPPLTARAQSVRGTIVDERSVPLSGVVVQLLDVSGTAVSRALSDESGSYRLAARASGRYRVRTQRIGFRPVVSEAFDLRELEEVTRPITMRGIPFSLDTVRVTERNSCRISSDTVAATFALWEQVRTALTAALVTFGNQEMNATTLLYERALDPASRRVESQSTQLKSGITLRAWYSLPPDSLHRAGYVILGPDRWTTYYAPDFDVLLSAPFLEDHCFRIANGPSPNLIALEFEPVRGRTVAEIRGQLLLDRKTAELKRLEYRYVNVRAEAQNAQAGGTVQFTRLRDGSWVIPRWDIRLPVLEETNENLNVGIPGASVARRVRVRAVKVSGGELALVARKSDTLWVHPPLTLSGRVVDSVDFRAIEGAILELRGAKLRAISDATGAFKLTGILPGDYTLVATTPQLDSLTWSVEMPLTIMDTSLAVRVSLPPPAVVAERFCPNGTRGNGGVGIGMVTGVLRINDSTPASGVGVSVQWQQIKFDAVVAGEVPRRADAVTDSRGVYHVCGVERDRDINLLTSWDPSGQPRRSVLIPKGALGVNRSFEVHPRVVGGATMTGRVVADSTKRPLSGAEVVLAEANMTGRTDSAGQYRITDIPPGIQTIIVRRVGYRPASDQIAFTRNTSFTNNFALKIAPQSLDSIVVVAKAPTELEERRKSGVGSFISRDELAKESSRRLSELMMKVSGTRIWRSNGNDAWIASGRNAGQTSILNSMADSLTNILDPMDIAKGAKPACYVDVWMDNTMVYSGRPKEPLFNVNSLTPDEVESIEFYAGPAQTPVRYSRPGAKCGVLVIKTRR
jgi:hypothetical protein